MDTLLELQETVVGTIPCIQVAGTLDVSNAACLRQKLDEMRGRKLQQLILNLDKMTFMDSTGLAVLLSCHKRLLETEATMAVICNSRPILRLFDRTGVGMLFGVYSCALDVPLRSKACGD